MDSKASPIAIDVVAERLSYAVLRIASEVLASTRRIPPSLPFYSKNSNAEVEIPTRTMMRDRRTTDRAVRANYQQMHLNSSLYLVGEIFLQGVVAFVVFRSRTGDICAKIFWVRTANVETDALPPG